MRSYRTKGTAIGSSSIWISLLFISISIHSSYAFTSTSTSSCTLKPFSIPSEAIIPSKSYKTFSLNLFTEEESESATPLTDKEKRISFQKDIASEYREERSYNTFGIFTPIAKTIDDLSGDWALSYADLSPSTPRTIEGRAFLATNVGYALAGIVLALKGDWFFAGLTELAGIVSFWYHYSQLEFGKDREEVRLALLTDYFTAGSALLTGGFYMIDMGINYVPMDALICGALSIVCLSLCWVWEFGVPYLFWHSLWHLFSAYTGFLIGQAHIANQVS